MKPRLITDDVYLLGAVDWDRRLFDSLIPLPHGTSYNSYFVQGSDKNALLDTVDPAKCRTLMAQLDTLPAPDYLVIHHGNRPLGRTPSCCSASPSLWSATKAWGC
jgi:flavorubredoxin